MRYCYLGSYIYVLANIRRNLSNKNPSNKKYKIKKMNTKLLLLLSLFTIFSCSNDDNDIQKNQVNIRLENNSDLRFENATYNSVNFGDIEPGERTEYKTFENQYSYGKVDITINGEEFGWVPIDFVGEGLLENGNYTFKYNFNVDEQILTDELIKD